MGLCSEAALARSGAAIATWITRLIMLLRRYAETAHIVNACWDQSGLVHHRELGPVHDVASEGEVADADDPIACPSQEHNRSFASGGPLQAAWSRSKQTT